jgi:CRISPR-associated protein Csx16
MNVLVSRHQGTIEWAKTKATFDSILTHLNLNEVNAGNCIYGNLPIHIAAQVCQLRARYFHLVLNLNENERGKELTAEQLIQNQAYFKEYIIGDNYEA